MFSAAVFCHFAAAGSSDHSSRWLTLCDLIPGDVEVMAAGNLSDHDQHAIVSVLERSSAAVLSMVLNALPWLLRSCSLHWGSCCDGDFHGNSATSGRWALFHLHDNCIRSKHHDNAGWAGRTGGRGSLDGEYLIGLWVMWLFDVTACHWTEGDEEFMLIIFLMWHCWSTLSLSLKMETLFSYVQQILQRQCLKENICKTITSSHSKRLSSHIIIWVIVINDGYSIPRVAPFLLNSARQKGLKMRHLWHTKVLFISVSLQVPGNALWLLNWHSFVPVMSKTRLQLCREQHWQQRLTSCIAKMLF